MGSGKVPAVWLMVFQWTIVAPAMAVAGSITTLSQFEFDTACPPEIRDYATYGVDGKILKVEKNVRISTSCLQALAATLENDTRVEELCFEGYNQIGPEGARVIGEIVGKSSTISSLSLESNDIWDDGAKWISEGVGRSTTLSFLSLYASRIGEDGAKWIGEGIGRSSTLSSLDLSDNEIGPDGAKWIGEGLGRSTTLSSLDLSGNEIGPYGAKWIGEGIGRSSILSSLDLSDNQIGPDGAKWIGEGLGRSTTLSSLELSGNEIGPDGAKWICEGLGRSSTLSSLDLSDNQIGPDGAKWIGEGLGRSTALSSLDLSVNEIGPDGAKWIGEGIGRSSTLSSLDLSDNQIGPDGAKWIGEGLGRSTTLSSLDLSVSEIGPDGAKWIGEGIGRSSTLSFLDLGDNQIGPDGAKWIGEGLGRSTILSSLDLRRNAIGPDGAKWIGEGLGRSTTLSSLDLSVNAIGRYGAKWIGEGMGRSTALSSLDLRRNWIGPDGAKWIGEGLVRSTTLSSVELSYNDIGPDGAKWIGEGLGRSSTLSSLGLSDNKIGPDGAEWIGEGMGRSTTLSSLDLSRNAIRSGAKWIGEGIEKCITFRHLDFSNNDIGFKGAQWVGRAMGTVLEKGGRIQYVILQSGKQSAEEQRGLQNALLNEVRSYMGKNETQRRHIIVLSVLVALGVICGVLAWFNRVFVYRTYMRAKDHFYPDVVDIPGISDMVKPLLQDVELAVVGPARAPSSAAGRGGGRRLTTTSVNSAKFEVGLLRAGQPRLAAGGLAEFIKASKDTMRKRYQDPLGAIRAEWEALPDSVYSKYMTRPKMTKAEAFSFIRYIIDEPCREIEDDSNAGDGQKVIRDPGRTGMTLEDFCMLEVSVAAGFEKEHCAATRIYSTSNFQIINQPFREVHNLDGFAEEHPVPVTVLVLSEAMKKQRALRARDLGTQESWRGMKDLTITEEYSLHGGTELAPMSTSTSMEKIGEYCKSRHPLILRIVSDNFMNRGCDISSFSLYPAEQEILFPPMTYIEVVRRRQIRNHPGWVYDVRPHIS